MIDGQTVFTNAGEENIFSGQNIVESVQNLETVNSVVEIKTETIDGSLQQIELKTKFARLKKAMRRRSVSIF